MSPRVGVARIRDGQVQVSFHRHRGVFNDERGRNERTFDDSTQPPALLLDMYPGRLEWPLESLRDPALPLDPEERP